MNETTESLKPIGKPIRVAWLIPTLDQGGAEKQLVTLATNIDRSLFEPHVITLTRDGPYLSVLEEHAIPVHRVEKRGKFDPFAIRRLGRIIDTIKPDVLHTWIFAANTYGRFVGLRKRIPVVLAGERSVDPWKRGWELIIDRYLSKRTNGIISNSSGVRDFYASKGIDPKHFHIIPNGISSQQLPLLSREVALQRMGLPPDVRIIGSVGRMWPQKGYKDLVWTAGMICVANPTYHYVVLGDGPQRPLLEQFRDTIGVATTVHLIGHRSDAADLIPHFDLLWNGSLYEGQSNVIMEAMRAKIPVIASDIPGNRDLIEHDISGLLYPVGASDQLAKQTTRLIQNGDLGTRLANAAYERLQREFSIEKMVKSHEAFYQQKLSEVGRRLFS
jgi:glycosyltransferase involved in cell wall biosynthesis